MSCGETTCPDFCSPPDGGASAVDILQHDVDGSNSAPFTGFLRVVEEFEREELQSIRDRANLMALDMIGSAERDALEALYRAADILDAILARDEAEMAEDLTEL